MKVDNSVSSSFTETTAAPVATTQSTLPMNPDQPMPPFDSTAPNVLSDPKVYFGNDVYSKTYIALDWMKTDPSHSTNDAEMFLLFLSSVCAVAHEPNSPYSYNSEAFNQFATELVAIQGPNGKSLIDECVDITMEELILSGQSSLEAALTIEGLFPDWPPGDPITNEARSEADTFYRENPDMTQDDLSQDDIEAEWAAFITDDSTIDGINQFEAENPPVNEIPMSTDNDTMPPYDPSAPGQMFEPGSTSGSDVLSKSYLWLDWLEKNPSNTNGAEVFLLYTSNLAEAGYFDGPDNALAEGLLAIGNGSKTLIAECVDITMEQMVVSGMTTQAAEDQIDALFPGDDEVSVAVRAEADSEQKELQADIDSGNPPTQASIDAEWYGYMTDPATVSSIEVAKMDLRAEMLNKSDDNVYVALMVLLLLLDAAGMNSMDAYGTLSNELAKETDELNALITEWDDAMENGGFETAEDAQQWMDDLASLKTQMDATPFDDKTHELIDTQFDSIYNQQAMVLSNGEAYPLYKDDNGTVFMIADDGTYVEVDDIEGSATFHTGQEPEGTLVPLTIGDQAYGYTDANGNSHDSNSIGLNESFNAFQPQPVNPDNPNAGGFSTQGGEIDSDLNALTNPLSQQTAAVGTEMQQTSDWVELVDNTFTATLLDTNTGYAGTMQTINNNLKA